MNLLGFISIVIGVTGLVWFFQMIFNGKDRIDINFSVGRRTSQSPEVKSKPSTVEQEPSISTKSDSVLGGVATFNNQNIQPSSPPTNHAVSPAQTPPLPKPEMIQKDQSDEDAYLNEVMADVDFKVHTNESILKEVIPGQLTPPLGQLTFAGFGSIAAQLPPDSFEKAQGPEQIEAMFAALRDSTQRIEQQMIALYEVHRSTQAAPNPTVVSAQNHSGQQNEEDSGDYNFGDDDSDEQSFGGGLNDQLTPTYPDNESQSAPDTEFISMDALGVSISDDAIRTYDASEALEAAPEVRTEVLGYMASVNITGELGYEVVEAIRRKAPAREVKHRVRQVLRAIDHFNLGNDANVALRVTAVFSRLPQNLGMYDNDLAAIGRRFGVVEPESDAEPLEQEDALVN